MEKKQINVTAISITVAILGSLLSGLLGTQLTLSQKEELVFSTELYERKIEAYQKLSNSLVEFKHDFRPSTPFDTLESNYESVVRSYYNAYFFMPERLKNYLIHNPLRNRNGKFIRKAYEITYPDKPVPEKHISFDIDKEDPQIVKAFLETYDPLKNEISNILKTLKKDLGTNQSNYNFIDE